MERFKKLPWNEKIAVALLALCLPLAAFAAVELKSGADTTKATIDSGYSALRVSVQPRSKNCYSITTSGNTISASLAANGTIFAMRISPTGGKTAYVYRAEMQYVVQTAGSSATNNVNMQLQRASSAAASGGTALTPFLKDSAGGAASQVATAQGGDARVSSGAALTVTGITFDSVPVYACYLGHLFTAGATTTCRWDVSADPNSHAIELEAGQLLVWRNGATAFPATQTWAPTIIVDWCEY